jgi:PKD domain
MIDLNNYLQKYVRWLLLATLIVFLWTGLSNGSGTDVNVYVEVIGNGETIPPEGDNLFYLGAIVDFSAIPGDGWYFNRWIIGPGENEINEPTATISYYIDIQKDIHITAVFTSDEDLTPIPEIVLPYGDVTIAPGESVNFQGTVTDGNPPYTCLWDFKGGAINSTQEDPGSQIFNSPGVYLIELTAVDDDGDTGTDTVTVTVSDSDSDDGGHGGGGGGCFIDTTGFNFMRLHLPVLYRVSTN